MAAPRLQEVSRWAFRGRGYSTRFLPDGRVAFTQLPAQRAAALLAAGVEEQTQTYDRARRFYRLRSRIVHGDQLTPANDAAHRGLVAGRELACRTLAARIRRSVPWDELMKRLRPGERAYIAA